MELHEALFWTANKGTVSCHLCPNNCVLLPNGKGPCRTRINKGNVLFTLAYNNPSVICCDPIEKKPLYHFKPAHSTYSVATNGCVLHCDQCQNNSISQCEPHHKADEVYSAGNLVMAALDNGCNSISLTYTDPIAFYEYSLDICKAAIKKSIPVVFVSSGYINPEPLKTLGPYFTAANIDLKSFNDTTYKTHFKGRLKPVLDTILMMKNMGIWLELTMLIIPGINDSTDEIKAMCEWMATNGLCDVPVHFTRFHPTYKLKRLSPTPLETLEMDRQTALDHGIHYVYIGNIGFDLYNHTHCHTCNTLLVERFGFTVASNHLIDGRCPLCNSAIPGIW